MFNSTNTMFAVVSSMVSSGYKPSIGGHKMPV